MAKECNEKTALGIIYRKHKPTFEKRLAVLQKGPLARQGTDLAELEKVLDKFG